MRHLALTLALLSPALVADDEPVRAPDAEVAQEVEAFERELSVALDGRDRAALERLLAEGFTFIHASGAQDTREEYIDRAAAGKLVRQRGETDRTLEPLRVYGGHTAIRVSRAVFFDQPVRNVSVYVRAAEGWRLASSQSTRLPARPVAVPIDDRLRDSYVGRYAIDAQRTLVVTMEGGALVGRVPLRPAFELVPRSDTEFIRHNDEGGYGDALVFVRNAEGTVAFAVLRDGDKEVWRAKRVD